MLLVSEKPQSHENEAACACKNVCMYVFILGGNRNLGIKNHENIKKIKTNFTKISRLLSTKNVMVLVHHRSGRKAALS